MTWERPNGWEDVECPECKAPITRPAGSESVCPKGHSVPARRAALFLGGLLTFCVGNGVVA